MPIKRHASSRIQSTTLREMVTPYSFRQVIKFFLTIAARTTAVYASYSYINTSFLKKFRIKTEAEGSSEALRVLLQKRLFDGLFRNARRYARGS